jgi:hypothetical protein
VGDHDQRRGLEGGVRPEQRLQTEIAAAWGAEGRATDAGDRRTSTEAYDMMDDINQNVGRYRGWSTRREGGRSAAPGSRRPSGSRPAGPAEAQRTVIESRWVCKPLAFAGELRPRRLNHTATLTLAVASSMTMTEQPLSMARASESSCRCPTLKLAPPS